MLCKEIRTYSRHAEELYYEAMSRSAGLPIRGCAPDDAITFGDGARYFPDHLLGVIRIATDLLVLVADLPPQKICWQTN